MEKHLSTMKLDIPMSEMFNALSGAEWNDEISASYNRFLDEEKNLLSNIKWFADKANKEYAYVDGVSIEKFKVTYCECLANFQRLQRGG